MNDQVPEMIAPELPGVSQPKATEDPLTDIKAKLTDAEKESFFKAFLSDQPYIAEETLFNGKLHLKFSSLNIKQNNTVLLQMQYDREKGIAKNTDAYLIKVIQYRIAASLLELDKKPFAKDVTEENIPNDDKEGATYLLKRVSLMEQWNLFKISSITDAFNRFEKKLRALTEESFKENF